MRVAIIGAGPAGLFTGSALARRGWEVTVVDRDPGPAPEGTWARRGVMQFHHAHAFRPQIADALRAEMPLAYDAWLDAGAEPVMAAFGGAGVVCVGVRSRRSTFEAALRGVAVRQAGVTIRRGHVEEVVEARGRAAGIRVDGSTLDADLVIDASGRSGRATRALGPRAAIGGDCGIAYVDRQYQLRPGAEPGPLDNPVAFVGRYDGYLVLVFPHERGIFSTVIVRSTADRDLLALRHEAAFEAAARSIPALQEWTDPARARPITPVLAGGTLMNVYRGQGRPDGGLILSGLFFVGDSVCTTTPNFGRGLATTMMQCVQLLRELDDDARDLAAVGERFDAWCEATMKPWVADHIQMDDALRRRWDGEDVDLSQPLPSDLIMEAAEVDSRIAPAIGPYVAMRAGPSSLRAVEPLARAVYATGWRPHLTPGPTSQELARIAGAALTPAGGR